MFLPSRLKSGTMIENHYQKQSYVARPQNSTHTYLSLTWGNCRSRTQFDQKTQIQYSTSKKCFASGNRKAPSLVRSPSRESCRWENALKTSRNMNWRWGREPPLTHIPGLCSSAILSPSTRPSSQFNKRRKLARMLPGRRVGGADSVVKRQKMVEDGKEKRQWRGGRCSHGRVVVYG